MFEWLKIWFKGYQTTFDSPYPIEQCEQILLDHAATDYFERPSRHSILIDVYHQSTDMLSFTMQKNILLQQSKKYSWRTNRHIALKVEIKGTVKSTETGTHITYSSQSNLLWGILMPLPQFVLMTIVLFFLLTPVPSPTIIQLINLLFAIVLAGLFLYAPIVYRIYRFSQFPHDLLSDLPQIPPEAIAPKRWYRFQHNFDFYAPYPLSTCIKKLAYPDSKREGYQLTPIGVLYGNVGLDRLFVGLKEISPEKTYFWIQADSPYQKAISATTFGMLQAEGDDYTRIVGFSHKPAIKFYWFGLVVLAMFLIIQESFLLFFVPLVYAGIKMVVAIETQELAQYPAKTILGRENTPQRNAYSWLMPKRKFDFHSPYPVDDCVNMLLGYSTAITDYPTQWGRGKGALVDNWLVIIYEQDEQTYQFIILPLTAKDDTSGNYLRTSGTLQTQGYGTHVRGSMKNPHEKLFISIFLFMVFVFALPILLDFRFALVWVGIAILIGLLYQSTLGIARHIADYPQAVLGAKASRKRKLADEAKSE